MPRKKELIRSIIERVNVNLAEHECNVEPYIRDLLPMHSLLTNPAFYGLSRHHGVRFRFSRSCLAGSYFLGRCEVDHSVLYKTDVRGDELKSQGDVLISRGRPITLYEDEVIKVKDSFLVKTLVHNHSHDPVRPEPFVIQNTVSLHYATLHGAVVMGCCLGSFATVDLSVLRNCIVGEYAYVQAGQLSQQAIAPGTVWIKSATPENRFEFHYAFPPEALARYVRQPIGLPPEGVLYDVMEQTSPSFEQCFGRVAVSDVAAPEGTFISRHSVRKGECRLGENVLIAQRSYLENATMGPGSNAQENCLLIGARLKGLNVCAHGAKVVNADLGVKTFVGFNSYLAGKPDAWLTVGARCIVMPHAIIDIDEPLAIPDDTLVWGCIRNRKELLDCSLPLAAIERTSTGLSHEGMRFTGDGLAFVTSFRSRIEHILQANGAYFDGESNRGHAQNAMHMSFNAIQPYLEGEMQGLYPTIVIQP